jgi:preprotein translocase subunit YajC
MTTDGTLWTLAQADGAAPVRGVLGAEGSAAAPGGPAAPAGTAADGSPLPSGQAPASPFGGFFFPLLLGLMVVMIATSMLGGRKEKRKRADMLSSLGKHDRVQTLGGIIGTIVEIRGDELVLRVDESSNTRIRFARSAVQTVLKSGGLGGTIDADEEKPAA